MGIWIEMPFFSIITPLYNKEAYFSQTKASVVEQGFSDWEWIIVDDGSTDQGPEIARAAAAEDSRIVFATQKNSGPCSARNHGIRLARGEWVLFLDADDVLDNSYLEEIYQRLGDSDFGIHAGGWAEYDAGLEKCVQSHRPAGYGSKNPSRALLDAAIAFAPWHPAAAVVQRKLLVGEFLWDEKMNRLMTEDTVFWWRLVATNKVKLENFCGVKYRRGTEGCRDKPENLAKWGESSCYALDANVNFWSGIGNQLTSEQVSNLVNVLAGLGRRAEVFGENETARKAYSLADSFLTKGPRCSFKNIAMSIFGSQNIASLKYSLK